MEEFEKLELLINSFAGFIGSKANIEYVRKEIDEIIPIFKWKIFF